MVKIYVVLFSEFYKSLVQLFSMAWQLAIPFERGALMIVLRTLDGAE